MRQFRDDAVESLHDCGWDLGVPVPCYKGYAVKEKINAEDSCRQDQDGIFPAPGQGKGQAVFNRTDGNALGAADAFAGAVCIFCC